MKIIELLSDSSGLASAVIEVAESEVADIDEMLKLLDGDSAGNFGIGVHLLSTDQPPKIETDYKGTKRPKTQFGFDRASIVKAKKRYYHVLVYRD
jgi:hypothetical protein